MQTFEFKSEKLSPCGKEISPLIKEMDEVALTSIELQKLKDHMDWVCSEKKPLLTEEFKEVREKNTYYQFNENGMNTNCLCVKFEMKDLSIPEEKIDFQWHLPYSRDVFPLDIYEKLIRKTLIGLSSIIRGQSAYQAGQELHAFILPVRYALKRGKRNIGQSWHVDGFGYTSLFPIRIPKDLEGGRFLLRQRPLGSQNDFIYGTQPQENKLIVFDSYNLFHAVEAFTLPEGENSLEYRDVLSVGLSAYENYGEVELIYDEMRILFD